MIKLCVFDLDGTLVDSLQDLADSVNYALEKNGFPGRETDEFRYLVGDGVAILLKRALGETYSEESAEKLLDAFNFYYTIHYADFSCPYNGCTELLHHLPEKNIQLAVLSNKPDSFTKIIVQKMFPEILFARVQGKSDQFPRKPDPASLLHMLKELRVGPQEVLYIGDTNVDVATAHNAGVKIAGVSWGFRGKAELMEAGADYIVDAPADIKKLLEDIYLL